MYEFERIMKSIESNIKRDLNHQFGISCIKVENPFKVIGTDTDCIYITVDGRLKNDKELHNKDSINKKSNNASKNKHIIIKTEKVVDKNGIRSRCIINIENVLRKEQLPELYLSDKEDFILLDSGVVSLNSKTFNLPMTSSKEGGYKLIPCGSILSEDDFKYIIEYIRRCGKRLHDINEKIEKEKNEWKGEETFTI